MGLRRIKAIWREVSDVTLYKDQSRRVDIEKFMKTKFYLVFKTSMHGGIGDQMYLNKSYFKRTLFSFTKKSKQQKLIKMFFPERIKSIKPTDKVIGNRAGGYKFTGILESDVFLEMEYETEQN
ncbi:MAG: hypothetical protein U0T68_13925 [Ferruginibacter sp.]